jgi:hypothetical protein
MQPLQLPSRSSRDEADRMRLVAPALEEARRRAARDSKARRSSSIETRRSMALLSVLSFSPFFVAFCFLFAPLPKFQFQAVFNTFRIFSILVEGSSRWLANAIGKKIRRFSGCLEKWGGVSLNGEAS